MPEAARRDYYEVLGVARDADAKAIKAAFRNLALKYHPDRNKEPGAEERFKEIAEAYAILSDPNKRADYDAHGHAGTAGFSAEDLFGGIDFDDLFGGLGIDFDAGPFSRFFHRHRAGPVRGANLQAELEISLERVASGGEETLQLVRWAECAACRGCGAKAGSAPRQCPTCGGSGRKASQSRRGGITFQQIATCPDCRGRGTVIDDPCPECHGQGRVQRTETLALDIPVGVEEGMALRVPGHGEAAPEPGGTPGDLFVVIRSRPDPRFERRGSDLWRAEAVDVPDAVLGTALEVPTLDGTVTVTVPPGAQPDTVLRLRGKGLPPFGGGGAHGDLYLSLRIRVPETLSPEERQLYQRLRGLSSR